MLPGLGIAWLWCRPAAIAPIQPLAWELPYAAGEAIKRKKKKYCIQYKISPPLVPPSFGLGWLPLSYHPHSSCTVCFQKRLLALPGGIGSEGKKGRGTGHRKYSLYGRDIVTWC